jgi:gas vesicle protein
MRFMRFLFGLLIGIGVGVLIAPQSGKQSRAVVRDKATKYSHDTVDFVDKKSRHMANKAKGYAHDVRKAVSGAVSKGNLAVEVEHPSAV